jgi:hypothetical protein
VKVIKEIDHDPRTVREVRVFVRQYIFVDGVSSYDVHLSELRYRSSDGELTDCLTLDDSFSHVPGDAEIEALPYIAPSVRREAPGVFYILTGPYRKGPYANRREANADIRAGRW